MSYYCSPDTHQKYTRITMSIGVRHSGQPFGITATVHWSQKRECPQVCPSFSSPAFSRPCSFCLLFSTLAFSRPIVFFVRHFQVVHFQRHRCGAFDRNFKRRILIYLFTYGSIWSWMLTKIGSITKLLQRLWSYDLMALYKSVYYYYYYYYTEL